MDAVWLFVDLAGMPKARQRQRAVSSNVGVCFGWLGSFQHPVFRRGARIWLNTSRSVLLLHRRTLSLILTAEFLQCHKLTKYLRADEGIKHSNSNYDVPVRSF